MSFWCQCLCRCYRLRKSEYFNCYVFFLFIICRTAVRQELEIRQLEGEKKRLIDGRDPRTSHMTLGPFSPEHHVDTSGALHMALNGEGVVTSPRESRRNGGASR